jgi:hypothetical protein
MKYTVSQVENLPKAYQAVMNYIVTFMQYHPLCYPTQERIATECGITRRHVNRIMGHLHRLGIILKKRVFGYFNRSRCYYKLGELLRRGADWFKNVSIVRNDSEKLLLFNDIKRSTRVNELKNEQERRKKEFLMIKAETKSKILRAINEGDRKSNFISKRICEIRVLPLTLAGKIKLAKFSDNAIDYAEHEFARFYGSAKGIQNAYSVFVDLCMKYCHKTQSFIDWSWPDDLSHAYGIEKETPLLKETGECMNYDDEDQPYKNFVNKNKQQNDYKQDEQYPQQRATGRIRSFDAKSHLRSMGIEDTDEWLRQYKELFK